MDFSETTTTMQQEHGNFSVERISEWMKRYEHTKRYLTLTPEDLSFVSHGKSITPLAHIVLNDDDIYVVREAKKRYFYSTWFEQQSDEYKQRAFELIGFPERR